jgi:hypothetical protein
MHSHCEAENGRTHTRDVLPGGSAVDEAKDGVVMLRPVKARRARALNDAMWVLEVGVSFSPRSRSSFPPRGGKNVPPPG